MTSRVMLLIDADNVSVGVIDQAVQRLLDSYGAVHVRRAYCTAEGAVKHQAAFKRLGIRPMVNLATGKNSTDIALAVDAIDLVTSERPEVVVIASSDSDFAPLVTRLREKGCRVEGIGQQGKTGEETQRVYDAYTVLAHREGVTAATRSPRGGSSARSTRTAVKTAAADEGPMPAEPAPKPAGKRAAKTAARSTAKADPRPAPGPASQAAEAPAPERTTAGRRRGRAASEKAPAAPSASPTASRSASAPANAPAPSPSGSGRAAPVSARPSAAAARSASQTDLAAVLAALPELAGGQSLALNQVSRRLREAGLLGANASTTRLLGRFADRLELLPAGQPNRVRLQAAS